MDTSSTDESTRELLKLSGSERAKIAGGATVSVGAAVAIVALLLAAFVLGNIEAPLFRPSSPAYTQVPVTHTIIRKIIIVKRVVVVIVHPGKVVVVRGQHHPSHHRRPRSP